MSEEGVADQDSELGMLKQRWRAGQVCWGGMRP